MTSSNKFTIPVDTTIGFTSATTGVVNITTPINPDISKLTSFISVLGTGISSGTLSTGNDGNFKHIIMSAIPSGSSYELTLTLLDPGSSSIASKKLVFTCAGQSSHLIYDAVLGTWIIANSGAFVSSL